MSFFSNLWASIKIFISNFTADYGHVVNLLVIAALVILASVFVWRGFALILRARKKTSQMENDPAPRDVVERASQSLSDAIKIETITGNAHGITELKKFLRARYPNVFEKMDAADLAGGSLILRWRGAAETAPVLFCAHMDTVPVEGQAWEGFPFSGSLENGVVYGRGALDCKNVLIGTLEAAESLIQEGFVPSRDIYFAYGSDEETGGSDGAANIAKVFEEKGVSFDFIIDEGGNIAQAHLGNKNFPAALIAVAEKGQATYRVSAQMQPGHAAMPPAHTALGVVCECVCRIEQAPMHKRILPIVNKCLKISAPALSIPAQLLVANLPYTKRLLFHFTKHNLQLSALLHTTFAATQANASSAPNVLPELAEIYINARTLQGDTTDGVLEYLRSLLADLPVTVEIISSSEPSEITPISGAQYGLVAATVTETFGRLACVPIVMPAGTDTKHYSHLSKNVLRFMPFSADAESFATVHGANERISQESLAQGVLFYKNLMKKI